MRTLFTSIAITTSVLGCASDTPPVTEELAQALTCPPPTIDPLRSLTVTDKAVMNQFSFKKVMTQISTSANATNTPTAMFQAWMQTFDDCTTKGIDPHHFGIPCRDEITDLAALDPFGANGYVPLAVVNRFDLAPKSGADCGEYRVVYGLPAGFERVARSLLIFEARMPNPRTDLGLAGCAPVADFWAELSTETKAGVRAQKLATFYFTGLQAGGETFEPVVSASHYGLATSGGAHAVGQIRTNMLGGQVWQLREFKLGKPCAAGDPCDLSVQHVTVKTNPANEVFANSDQLATDFQTKFLKQVPALSSTDLATIGMTTPNTDNEYESVSLGAQDVVYRNFANSTLRSEIQGVVSGGLSVDNVLDRATTQTCAGCHQFSNSVNLGPGKQGLVWPNSLGFVQISEQQALSPAIKNVFLPHRAQVLNDFLAAQCTGQQTVDDGTNLGGGALDAAN